jgi:rhodanese-related sulfurtransferase
MLQTAIGWVIVSALIQNLDKNIVFVYCKSGNRSGKAVKKARRIRF